MGICLRVAIWHQLAHRPPLRDLGGLQCTNDNGHDTMSTADAKQIIHYWKDVENVNDTAWIIPLLFALTVIQFFGVKGYGEVCGPSRTIALPADCIRSNSFLAQ